MTAVMMNRRTYLSREGYGNKSLVLYLITTFNLKPRLTLVFALQLLKLGYSSDAECTFSR